MNRYIISIIVFLTTACPLLSQDGISAVASITAGTAAGDPSPAASITEDTTRTFQVRPVLVTATRTELEPFAIPREVVLIDAQRLNRQTVRMIPDALAETPSILVQKTNYGGGAPVIRGLIGNQVLILVDGIRLNNSTFRFGPNQYLNTVSPSLIERVEVVEGPGSVLYGSDALGGTINLISRNARTLGLSGIQSTTRAATADRSFQQHIDWWSGVGTVKVLAGAGYQKFNDLSTGRGYQHPTGFSGYDGTLRIDFSPTAAAGTFTGVYQFNQWNNVPRTDKYASGDDLKYLYAPQRRDLAYVSYTRNERLGFIDKMKATVSLNRQLEGREEITVKRPLLETRDRDDVRTLGASLEFHTVAGASHLFTYGAEIYADNIHSKRDTVNLITGKSGSTKPQFPDGSTYRMLGVFLQDQIDLAPLFLVPGIRYSTFRFHGNLGAPFGETISTPSDVTFNVNALVKAIPDRLNLVLGVAQGFRAPNVDDIAVFGKSGSGSGARLDAPSPGLEPEKSMNYEGGIKYQSDNAVAGLFYFRSEYTDLIVPKPGLYNGNDSLSGLPVYQRQNVGKTRISGVNLNGLYKFTSALSARAEVSWTVGNNLSDNEPLTRIPPTRGIAGISYTADRYWLEYYNLFAAYQERLSSADKKDSRIGPTGTPGYVTFNLRGGTTLVEGVDLSLTLENIFNRLYKIHGSGVYSPGRNLVMSLVVKP